jgi:transposase-like protein
MDTVTRKRDIPPHIAQHFKAHTASGKTIKEYSSAAGLSPLTFYMWRKKYRSSKTQRNRQSNQVPQQQRFSTVGTISLQQLRSPLFDIHLSSGLRVSIYSGTTTQELAPFLELLTGRQTGC